MKTMLSLFLLIALGVNAQGVAEAKYSEPEFVGDVKYVGSGKDVLLPKERSFANGKVGFYSAKARSIIKGLESAVKINPIEKHIFLVRVKDNSINPKSVVNVFKLEQDKKAGTRFVTVATEGTFSGTKSTICFLDFEYSKYGEGCYIIVFPKSLDVGEYAITLEGSRMIFNVFSITTEP